MVQTSCLASGSCFSLPLAILHPTGPVYLFFFYHSHISLEVICTAQESNVKLYCLLPNCTHILQPLDVGMFDSVKNTWGKVLKQWKLETRGQNVSKDAFLALIVQLWAHHLHQCSVSVALGHVGFFLYHVMPWSPKPGPKDMQSHCSTGTKQTSVPNSLFIRTHLHG